MATQLTIETLFGGKAAAKVLLFMENYGDAYASRISNTFDMPVSEVQKQLKKYEEAGIFVSRNVGKSRVYTWNSRDPDLEQLRSLLGSTLRDGIPDSTLKKYYRDRQRPRRAGKPL